MSHLFTTIQQPIPKLQKITNKQKRHLHVRLEKKNLLKTSVAVQGI